MDNSIRSGNNLKGNLGNNRRNLDLNFNGMGLLYALLSSHF
jgi:hypothetical protein